MSLLRLMEFPKICPAVIIGVTCGDKILMSKYAGRDFTDYACWPDFARWESLLRRRCAGK